MAIYKMTQLCEINHKGFTSNCRTCENQPLLLVNKLLFCLRDLNKHTTHRLGVITWQRVVIVIAQSSVHTLYTAAIWLWTIYYTSSIFLIKHCHECFQITIYNYIYSYDKSSNKTTPHRFNLLVLFKRKTFQFERSWNEDEYASLIISSL